MSVLVMGSGGGGEITDIRQKALPYDPRVKVGGHRGRRKRLSTRRSNEGAG